MRFTIPLLRRLIPLRVIPPIILIAFGCALVVLYLYFDAAAEFLLELWPIPAIYLPLAIGVSWFILVADSSERLIVKDFSDVDIRRRSRDQDPEIRRIINESSKSRIEDRKQRFKGFEEYFDSLSFRLEEQSQTADEKASILLDKGTAYSRNGVFFFLITIIVWQVVFIFDGFKTQHIYGIASCSLLFIFIEFLSAWFLRQYRHYVDTSTYLLKVKSIFDRYMLVYLVISGGSGNEIKYASLADMLSEDIKWPESYLMKNPDLNFAKEALETITHFAKTVKSEAKNSSSKKGD